MAVDYDEAIAEGGQPIPEVIAKLCEMQRQGSKIMLWTARTGKDRQDAIDRCKEAGLTFDGIYDDKPDADAFIGDKAMTKDGIIGGGEANAD